jgi:MatE
VSLAIVLSRVSPAHWTRCCQVLGRHHNHNLLGSGHSAWVSDMNRELHAHLNLRSYSINSSCYRGCFFDSMFIFVCIIFHNSPINCQPVYLLWFNAETVLLFLRQQPDVAHLAAVYLKYASIGLPAYAFNCLSRCDLYPTKGTRLTFFKSIFPVTGSLCSSYPDYPRGRAN